MRQWIAFRRRLRAYFDDYGGWAAVFGSPLFHIAVFITLINYDSWLEPKWVDKTQSLIPNLLGFSLGTYALLFSLLEKNLKRAIRSAVDQRGVSWLNIVNATFFHFIFVQVVALTWSFLPSFRVPAAFLNLLKYSYKDDFQFLSAHFALLVSFVGHLLLAYSILLTLASALAVYRITLIKDPPEKE